MTTPIAHLQSLLEAWKLGRDRELLVDGDTLYWQLTVVGWPYTAPQTCAELANPRVDGPILVAAVNALPALLAIAEAAVAWRQSDEADDGFLPPTRRAADLIEAIDAFTTGPTGPARNE